MEVIGAKTAKPLSPLGVFTVFVFALVGLNVGLYSLLAPEQTFVTQLPYGTQSLADWQIISGDWQSSNGLIEQLEPSRALAISPLQLSKVQRSHEAVRLHVRLEPGSGLSFAMKSPQELNESHVVFLSQDSFFAAYVTAEGRLQDQTRIALPTLSERSERAVTLHFKETTYDVFLEHQLLIKDLPILSQGTYLGLLTDGLSRLHGLMVDTSPNSSAPTTAFVAPTLNQSKIDFQLALANDWKLLSGNWFIEQGKLLQNQEQGFDQLLMLPFYSENQLIKLELSHLSGFGGGLVFNSPSMSSKAGAHLLRFHQEQGKKLLFWGYFDVSNKFVGQGSRALASDASASQQLSIRVHKNSYAILLNDLLIVENVPLFSSKGYLGLTSSQSSVSFNSLELEVLE